MSRNDPKPSIYTHFKERIDNQCFRPAFLQVIQQDKPNSWKEFCDAFNKRYDCDCSHSSIKKSATSCGFQQQQVASFSLPETEVPPEDPAAPPPTITDKDDVFDHGPGVPAKAGR